MPTLRENIEYWDKKYPWEDEGREWSYAWGSPETQWHGSIFWRIRDYLPVTNILEIAPGYGRWTSFLQQHCSSLQAVDVSRKCISYCRNKFRTPGKLSFYRNNGKTLPMIAPGSIDFVFSFDSFVHFNNEIVNCYLAEISAKLKNEGIGFIHHSNVGRHYHHIHNDGWRSADVSCKSFEEACNRNGLQCISQEQITWGTNHDVLTDCFTIFTKTTKKITTKVIENFSFMDEASWLKNITSSAYP